MDKQQFKKSVIAASIAAALGLSAVDAMADVAFKNNGTGGSQDINQFNINASNWLFENVGPTLSDTQNGAVGSSTNPETPFTFLGQGVIGNFITVGNVQLNAASGFEYTFIMSVPMLGQLSGGGATQVNLNAGITAGASTFQIFYGPNTGATASNAAAGTGFNDDTLILTGHLDTASLTVTNKSSGNTVTSNPLTNLNQSSGGTTDRTIATIQATGSSDFHIQVDTSNAAFFPGNPTFLTIGTAFTVGPEFLDPFKATQVSTLFFDGHVPDFGNDTVSQVESVVSGLSHDTSPATKAVSTTFHVNNFQCGSETVCDFIASGTSLGSIEGAFVPEPGSLALLGLGLAGLGFGGRRAKRNAS